ncbi:MAG: hypothetical protein D6743_12075 [Calditrichaeota bacterium]|nr:MAG: hypothetical protein D6743_12075 [Calditrichota bacterium]
MNTRNFKTFFLFACSCWLIWTSTSEATPEERSRGGSGYFMVGGHQLRLSALNAALSRHGYPTFSQGFVSLGGGGYGFFNRLMVGGEGHGLLSPDGSRRRGDFKTSLTAGYGFFDLGYLIVADGPMRVYPVFGFGGGGLSLKIRPTESLTFDDVLSDPRRGATLSTGGLLLNLGFGAEYAFYTGEDGAYRRGLVVGLRVGYVLAPVKGDWSLEGLDVGGGPDLGITGPYVRLLFGGGRFPKPSP